MFEVLQERAAMSPEEGGEFVKGLRATFSALAVQIQIVYTVAVQKGTTPIISVNAAAAAVHACLLVHAVLCHSEL